jgi:hypothetical protein
LRCRFCGESYRLEEYAEHIEEIEEMLANVPCDRL